MRAPWGRPLARPSRTANTTPRTLERTERRTPTIRDDAAHGRDFAKNLHTEWFTEWWYFNVRDPKTGLSLLFMLDVTPFGLGLGAFMALVFPPNGDPFDVEAIAAPSDVSFSYEWPDVK